MKTAYYTFTTWENSAMAAGFDGAPSGPRQAAMVRQPEGRVRPAGRDNVVDLNAWRAAEPDEPQTGPWDEPGWDGEGQAEELVLPAARPRRDHRRAMLAAELVSTLCVAAVTVAIIVRVLTF